MSELVLVVDDERDLVATLEYNLQRNGYRTRAAYDGQAAIELGVQAPVPDLVLLDLNLPDMAGVEVCRALRADPRTREAAILMLTAKDEEIDRVVGFEVGADDYVVKPFSVRELMLRVRAILRRARPAPSDAIEFDITTFGSLKIQPEAHRAWVEGEELALTALEFRLLGLLLSRRGRVQSRSQLLDEVWGIQAEVTTRTVDTHVKRLRQKLRAAGRYIETVRGVGYRFAEQPTGAPS